MKKSRSFGGCPQIGHRYERYLDLNVRILLYGHYRIAYLIKENGSIDILGIFHGALDIDRYLSGGPGDEINKLSVIR